MKSICLTIVSLFSIAGMSQSLTPQQIDEGHYSLHNTAIPYRQLISDGSQYFAQDSSLWNTQGYKAFSRMSQFWESRAYGDGDTTGGTSSVEKASITLLQSTIDCDLNSSNLPNWQFLGPDESTKQDLGIIISLALDPMDNTYNTIYAGTNASGLWKTTNGMSAQPIWTCITESTNLPALGVQDIVIDPTNPAIIYIATGVSTYQRGYGIGILKTTDGGQTWDIVYGIGASEEKIVWKLLIDPTNSDIIYAGAGSDLIRTFDGGLTWEVIFTVNVNIPSGEKPNHIVDLEFALNDATHSTIYVSTKTSASWNTIRASFFKILNSKSVTPIQDLTVTQPTTTSSWEYNIATTPAAPQNIYLMNGTVYVSSDGGVNWLNAAAPSSGPTISFSSKSFKVSPRDPNVFYAGAINFYKADMNAVTKQFVSKMGSSAVTHADIRDILVIDLGGKDGVFIGTDGGISYNSETPFWSGGWRNLNGKGLQITQFYKLGGAEKYPNLLLGGCQDNGTKKINNNVWTSWITGGDGGECLIDGNNPNIYYTIENNAVRKSGGGSSPPAQPYVGSNMTFHSNNFNAISYSRVDVYETQNQAQSWSKQTNLNQQISCIAVSESNPLVKYYATSEYLNNNAGIIWKTTDGGLSWIDITSGFGVLPWKRIADIEINPENPNEIWVGMSDFYSRTGSQNNNWDDGIYRVFHSSDGGLTYEGDAFSIGLPYFPVNNIVYQKGAGILYAATDIGVYYKKLNEPNAVWARFCDNLPVCIVSDMEINYCAQKLRIATFGRGLWEADLIKSEQEITSTTLWSIGSERVVPNNLVIKSGVTLTIKGTAFIPESGKIIIEQGGKLIVDGGTITNQCGKMWRGIEVWGNMNLSQSTVGTQGRLEIKNGALIENCHSIHASKHDANGQYVWGTFGGIIQISNSTLKNNKSGVEFGPYQNFNPNNPAVLLSDLSFIRDNQFIWDNTGSMSTLGLQPYSFIGLWETHGIGIQGNTFKNNFYSNEPQYQKGVGIITYDADFSVLPSCTSPTFPCPTSSNVPNTFESLNYGIKAHGISNVARVIVDGNVFTNNRFGVGLLATTYTSVIRNSFNIPISTIPIESGGDAIGIYSTGSYGFNFEENQFNTWGTGPSNGSNYGIVSENSDFNGGLAYKNEFNNLIVASLNSQVNTSLKIDCNNFNTGILSRYDMAITSGNLANQGFCASPLPSLKPAKNSFNAGCSGEENIFHYPNSPASLMYSALSSDLPSCITVPEVSTIACNPANTPQNQCPSNITTPVAPSELVANIDANKIVITNLKEQFDGGNQSGLLSAISSMSNGQVKNELLAASPYLSDKVLVSFLQKPNLLPAGHVKQIIVANSPVTEKVKQILDAVALPNGIRSQIEAAQTDISARKVLENEIAQLELENQLMKNEYIRQCLDQKLLNNAKNLLDNGNLCSDKASLLPIVVKEDLSRTNQLISEIRDEVVIIRDEIPNCPKAATLEKICDFYDEVKTKIASTGSFKITSAADEQNIRVMAAKTGATAINAQNALSLFKGENIERFAEPIILTPSNTRLLKPQTSNAQFQSGVDYKLNNYPNPFNESTVIEANIPENTFGEIIITDVTGKQVQRVILSVSKNKVELQGNELGYGIFFYSLYINGEYIQTKKLTRIQ